MNRRFSNLKEYFSKNNEVGATYFLLKLLILLSLLKLIFCVYNAPVLGNEVHLSVSTILLLLKWSLAYDLLTLLFINTPFFIVLTLLALFRKKIPVWIVTAFFLILNFSCVVINLVDIFYFHFHLQRADADLLYVVQHPFQTSFIQNPISSLLALAGILLLFLLILRIHRKLLIDYFMGNTYFIHAFAMLICCGAIVQFEPKKLVPTYPLTELNSTQLQVVENSMHSFAFSLFRRNEGIIRPYQYLPNKEKKDLFNIRKKVCAHDDTVSKKNIVLFIMESIPEDFFNNSGKYKVKMPFLDSLLQKSTYFKNAYSYSHNSNKGIVAILAGIPTLTEIPLYHSNYATLKITPIGKALSDAGYNSSFFIGDSYDDYGFAKCCNWLGIRHYYCKDDIPGNAAMEKHTLGLHDRYVLDFMGNKLNNQAAPFFAVNYNISTHFPNDLPAQYKEKYPERNFSLEMKSMNYYNECLQHFFDKAAAQPWFNNTVFVFCSDHWMYPDTRSLQSDLVQDFHIPIFIYDPAHPAGKVVNNTVSQLDIINTILCIAGAGNTLISYGENLLDNDPAGNRTVFCKENSTRYQAIDSSYVLGFNIVTAKPEFCFDYRNDLERKHNLCLSKNPIVDSLTYKIKAFLQKASYHYNKLDTAH